MEQPKIAVSVIVPTYNVARYVRKCLDSIRGQTLRDIEVICVDDGSSDGSAEICEAYARKDSRVRVVKREHTNAGATRNAGLDVARGEYIGFVDSDDWCDKHLFEKAYNAAKAADADIVSWGFREYDSSTGRLGSSRLFSGVRAQLPTPHSAAELGEDVFNPLAWGPWDRLVKSDFLKAENIRFQEITYADDVYICCLEYVTASRQVILNEPLYYYRVASGNSQQQSNAKHTENIISAWVEVAGELERRKMIEEFRMPLIRSAYNSFFHSLVSICESSAYCRFYQQLRKVALEHPLFKAVQEDDIDNDNSRFFLKTLRECKEPIDFLVLQSRYYDRQCSKSWWDLQEARAQVSELAQCEVPRGGMSLRILPDAFFSTRRLKRLRGIVKQFLPYGYMRRHLIRVYGIVMPERGKNAFTRALWNMVPFYFAGDKRLLDENARRERLVALPKVARRSTRRLAGMKSAMRGKDEESAFSELSRKVERIVREAAYDLVGQAVDEAVVFWRMFPGDANKSRLSALLHRLRLPFVLDLLDVGLDDDAYQSAIDIFNAPPCDLAPSVSGDVAAVKSVPPEANPKLSFIVPVFNAERYLIRCMESLRRQTEQDIEIICIDDGSHDASAEILDEIAKVDGRMRVVHKENEGVSVARNLGLDMARGRYVAFVDGDDWVSPELADKTIRLCDENDLQVCFFDYECFDARTKEREDHYWTLSNHSDDWIFDRVFSMRELPRWSYYGSSCTQVYRRDFISGAGIRFPVGMKLSEDAMFVHSLMPLVERALCIRDVMYHYRRGDSSSAVARLSGSATSQGAVAAKIQYLDALEKMLADYYRPNYPVTVCAAFADRVSADLEYHAKATPAVEAWLADGHCTEIAELAKWWKGVPAEAIRPMLAIEAARRNAKQDMYLVAGQLASPNVDQVDSWQFFKWLQDHDVPSRYLVWRESSFYKQIVREGSMKDVVVMETNCRNDELLRHADLLIRAKAFVVEWQLDGFLDEWLRGVRGLNFVFLQHGVTGCWLTPEHQATFRRTYNYCNVFSRREQKLIEGDDWKAEHSRFFVAGLPRFDLLDGNWRKSQDAERHVFVMFTWRQGLNVGGKRLMSSAYWQGLAGLLSERNLKRLARIGVKLVVAPHHRLSQFVPNLDFGPDVKVVSQQDIAYWIRHADAMVTDFSSASFDFMFQNKPTIYWIPDKDDPLIDHSAHQDGGKVDSALALRKNFYNTVDTLEEVMHLIEYYNGRDFELEPDKRAIASTYFDVRENISQTVYEQLEKISMEEES